LDLVARTAQGFMSSWGISAGAKHGQQPADITIMGWPPAGAVMDFIEDGQYDCARPNDKDLRAPGPLPSGTLTIRCRRGPDHSDGSGRIGLRLGM